MRIGIGYDIHRLSPSPDSAGIPLGGIMVPCPYRVEAHSDGDVLIHALVDALLGALALGDIGSRFPDNAAENKDRKSTDFLKDALEEIAKMGYRVGNMDSVVQLEAVKLAPHRDRIRSRLASLLGIELTSISVKAKTMEGLGAIGENRALSAQVTLTLEQI